MTIVHAKSVTVADFTGTVTAFNSQGSTTTVAASDLARPSDWNSGHNQLFTLSGNTTNASTASGTNVVLQGGAGIVLGGSTATIDIGLKPVSGWNPYPDRLKVAGALASNGGVLFDPKNVPVPIVFDRAAWQMTFSNATNSSGSATLSVGIGWYTLNGSTLSLAHSASATTALTMSGTAGSWSLYSGMRLFTHGFSTTVQPGDYWIGFWSRTTTGGANMSIGNMFVSAANSVYAGFFGQSHNTTQQITLGQGLYTATTSALPASVAISQLRGSDSGNFRAPAIYFPYSTI